jgi:hypothetical protein
LPGPAAPELQAWLQEIGLARFEGGRIRWDERHLCHAPQERLWFEGAWHDSLLPPMAPGSAAARQAQQLSVQVAQAQRLGFSMPSGRSPWRAGHAELDAQTFAQWLQGQGITDPALRWYLDYCCRDDYGAPAAQVSAWAGVHYFASRHGFAAPGEGHAGHAGHAGLDDSDGVLTWPEGNAWLVERLARPLGDRLLTQRLVQAVQVQRHAVQVQAAVWPAMTGETWLARQVVLAVPLAFAARLLEAPPEVLRQAAGALPSAPWLVANLLLERPPLERPGLPRAWDNVVFGQAALGYVHARHQQLAPAGDEGLQVITAYHALNTAERGALLQRPWRDWARQVVQELALVHPDLPALVRQVDLARHGHAMSIPAPGVRGHPALAALRLPVAPGPRLHLAHADLVGYSVFEEAFTLGLQAGRTAAEALRAGGSARVLAPA